MTSPFTPVCSPNRWLIENESGICDNVRGTTLGAPPEIEYEAVATRALAGELDWIPPAFVYRTGEDMSPEIAVDNFRTSDWRGSVLIPRTSAKLSHRCSVVVYRMGILTMRKQV